ncbi:MAG TPA: DUF167 domain-containing protein [Acidimicrobiales bacterium]|nr:DUF167 domain-containing protein [Acidimicrobiales bacterium]
MADPHDDGGVFTVTRDGDVVLTVHVQPGAGREGVAGRHGDALKLRVTAPAVGGRANEAVRRLVARELGVRPAAVELVGGASSRRKRLRLVGVDRRMVASWLAGVTGG